MSKLVSELNINNNKESLIYKIIEVVKTQQQQVN